MSFPNYIQLDSMDCGPTCLRIIAAFYGRHYSLQNLRDRCHITREGVSLLGISDAAESIGEEGNIFIRTSVFPTMLEIADTGAGISKEVEAKLFSPFFSTKPNGQGIGLIFIREVLMRHGCTFSLRTYADGLTRFRILFP